MSERHITPQQAKRLYELGVRLDTNRVYIEVDGYSPVSPPATREAVAEVKYGCDTTGRVMHVYPAPDMGELWEAMPHTIDHIDLTRQREGRTYYLTLDTDGGRYENAEHTVLMEVVIFPAVVALADLLIAAIEGEYVRVDSVNERKG